MNLVGEPIGPLVPALEQLPLLSRDVARCSESGELSRGHTGAAGWVGLAVFTSGQYSALFFLLATNLGLAFGDVIAVRDLARHCPSPRPEQYAGFCQNARTCCGWPRQLFLCYHHFAFYMALQHLVFTAEHR